MNSLLQRRTIEMPSLILAALISSWCVALWLARVWFTSDTQFFYLVYNLGLALVPLFFGTLAVRSGRPVIRIVLFAFWLAFFPNAPYLLTDLIHLRPRPDCPFWFDWLLFVSMAGAGLMIGVISLAQVHHFIGCRTSATTAHAIIAAVVTLSAFGIYLGRFLRWNSWDFVTRPGHLLAELGDMIFHPFDHPRMLAYSFGVAVILGVSYFGPLVVFRSMGPQRGTG